MMMVVVGEGGDGKFVSAFVTEAGEASSANLDFPLSLITFLFCKIWHIEVQLICIFFPQDKDNIFAECSSFFCVALGLKQCWPRAAANS